MRLEADGHLRARLAPGQWMALVQCPMLSDDFAVIGDPHLFVPAGDRRVSRLCFEDGCAHFEVLGAAGQRVEIVGVGRRAPSIEQGAGAMSHDADSSLWRLELEVGCDGVSEFSLAP